MLTIRPIAAGELSAFLALQPDPERAADQAAYVDRMFAAGAMRPEWCYLAIDGDHVVGRFAFWSLPKLDVPISLVLVDAAEANDGNPARAAIADALLQRAIKDALSGSPDEFGYVLDEPEQTPQWQLDPNERATWLRARGVRGHPIDLALVVRRPSARGAAAVSPSERTKRSGRPRFSRALEEVSSSTLDARVEADRDRLGAAAEARRQPRGRARPRVPAGLVAARL